MEQEQEKIILENSFAELSAADKVVLSELISSEEEFDVLKQILATAPSLNEGVTPSEKLKASLMVTFAAQYGTPAVAVRTKGSTSTKIILLRSVAAIAAIFILFMFLFPFGNNKAENNLTADNKVKTVEEKDKPAADKAMGTKKVDTVQQESIEPIQESTVQVAVNNVPKGKARSESSLDFADGISSNTAYFLDAAHSDRLASRDLPEKSRQVVLDNPALLDVLYTAF